jgi:acyl-CoA synthetase (AMP-forming)/AMP-acid ligase II
LTGGTTVPARALDFWTDRGVAVVQSYGLTEAGGSVTLVPIEEAPAMSATAGRAMPKCEIRIVDSSDHPAPPGQPGEIVVHGPSLMCKYWQNPQATTQAISDGWLRTGDWGYLDPDGYLHVVDRIKEVIIVGVSNVAPADLEAVLADSPRNRRSGGRRPPGRQARRGSGRLRRSLDGQRTLRRAGAGLVRWTDCAL